MIVYISMLRGVNVGGHNKVNMQALKAIYESLGLKNAQTLIQSGNVVFLAKEQSLHCWQDRSVTESRRSSSFGPA